MSVDTDILRRFLKREVEWKSGEEHEATFNKLKKKTIKIPRRAQFQFNCKNVVDAETKEGHIGKVIGIKGDLFTQPAPVIVKKERYVKLHWMHVHGIVRITTTFHFWEN